MSVVASQITNLTIVYATVYSGADQRKHQSSTSLAFVRRIHRRPVNSPHKGPVTRKMFSFDDVIMAISCAVSQITYFHIFISYYFMWMELLMRALIILKQLRCNGIVSPNRGKVFIGINPSAWPLRQSECFWSKIVLKYSISNARCSYVFIG